MASNSVHAPSFIGGSSRLAAWRTRSHRRRLQVEWLEARYALSSVLDPCLAAPLEPVAEDTTAVVDTTTSAAETTEEPVVGPLDADDYYAVLAEGTSEIQAEGEAPLIEPPVLDAFEVDSTTSYWYISGHVSDEQIEMFGHVVRLGGLLEGVQLDLLPDGSFFYYTLMPPGTTGTVTAVAIDNTGLLSNTATVEVLA